LPKERVLKAWKEVWQPREDKYIAETNPATYADIVIDGNSAFETQIAA
jgi:uridine kinase